MSSTDRQLKLSAATHFVPESMLATRRARARTALLSWPCSMCTGSAQRHFMAKMRRCRMHAAAGNAYLALPYLAVQLRYPHELTVLRKSHHGICNADRGLAHVTGFTL